MYNSATRLESCGESRRLSALGSFHPARGKRMKHCTACRSTHVRRSGTHPEEGGLHPFQSPYRCLDCGHRFWVISRRARVGALAGGLLVATVVLAITVPGHLPSFGSSGLPGSAPVVTSGDVNQQRSVDDLLRQQNELLTRSSEPRLQNP